MAESSIEWTEMTWNPTTGCTKISAGCKFCYAEVMARRLKAMGLDKYKTGFRLAIHEDTLDIPYTWKGSRIVFVNSMSDLFHEDVPLEFIKRVFKVMNENLQHTFQVLTKRPDVLLKYDKELNWSHNIWMGVSVEDDRVLNRIDDLRKSSALVKFLGGESGRKPRPMDPHWVLDIKSQCRKSNVAFFFKQWGGTNKKKTGRLLNGRTYDEMPKVKRKKGVTPVSNRIAA